MKAPQIEAGRGRADVAVRAALRVPGVPLDARLRERFEAAFDCDLGHVRIHTDAAAARAAHELDAVAFALGRDVFFAAGAFEPHRPSGAALLAHEMSHAIDDQRVVDAADVGGTAVASADSALERGATAAEERERGAGFIVAPAPAPRATRPQIARFAAGLMLRDPRDPAQLVATLVTMIAIALRNDPDDRLGRVRRSLKFLDDATRALALEQLERELVAPDWHHLSELLAEDAPAGADQGDGRAATSAGSAVADDGSSTAEADRPPQPAAAAAAAAVAEPEPAEHHAAEPVPKMPEPAGATDAAAKPAEHDANMKLHGAHPRPHHGSAAARPRAARPATGHPAERPAPGVAAGGPEPEPAGGADVPEAATTADDAADAAVDRPEPAESAEAAAADPQAEPEPESVAAEIAPAPEAGSADTAPADAPEAAAAEAVPPEPATDIAADAGTETAPAVEETADTAGASEATDGTPEDAASAGEVPAGTPPLGELPTETDDGSEAPSGGSSGGSAIPEPAEEPSAALPTEGEPASVLGAVAGEPPNRLMPLLDGVGGAVERTVGADRGALAANPPVLSADETARAAAPDQSPARAAVAVASAAIARVPAGAPPAPVVLPEPPQPGPAPEIRAPAVTSNADGELTAGDAQRVAEAVDDLPTTDPALDVTVAQPPEMELTGAADPAKATAQRDALTQAASAAAATGRADAAEPMGESHIVAKPLGRIRGEAIVAPAAGGRSAAAAGGTATGATDPAVAAVARERSGDEVQGAVRTGVTGLTQQRSEQRDHETQQRADSQRAIDAKITANAAEQNAARHAARAEVTKSRRAWTSAQTDLVTSTEDQGDAELTAAHDETAKLRNDARTEAQAHVDDANREVLETRRTAEKKAADERERAKREKENAGFFSRAASAIGDFFSDILDAIKGAFAWARDKINKAIAAVTKFVADVIDKARNLIVAAIKKVGDALIALGDTMLAAFPGLRDKWRAAIHKAVDGAVAAVNRFADNLKKGITGLLNLLGKALNAILDAYEALALAAVNAVASAVKGALAAAKGLIDALGTFAVLIRDIARDPGQWISNLGAALMDGVRVHLWTELKAAVKEWFNSKVEAVVGVGKMILDVLKNGGLAFRRIAAMVWAAVKAAIPRAIIEFLIQKVISMIIPAAGAIMAIIEGLQAAWATVSRIIAAFERFVAFLKAVKDGNAGQLFARAVAAAAVAVIDFTANFIISKIGKAAVGVGGKLKSIATKLMAWFKRGAKAVGRVAKRVGALVLRGARAVGRGIRAAGHAIANSRVGLAIRNSRVGRFVGKQAARAKAAYSGARDRIAEWRRRRNTPEAKLARLNKAVAAIAPVAQRLLARGISPPIFWLRVQGWILRYGLTSLKISGGELTATVNPSRIVTPAEEVALGQFLLEAFAAVEARLTSAVREYDEAAAWRTGGVPGAHDPAAFAKLNRLEQAAVIRSGNPELSTRTIEPGVTARLAHADNPAAIEVRVGGRSPAYLKPLVDKETGSPILDATGKQREAGIAPMLESATKDLGLTERETAGLLLSSRTDLDANLALLEESYARRKGATQPPGWRARAYNLFRRSSFLVSALEPSRRAGIATAVATAGSLAFSDKVALREFVATDYASMAHPLASSQRNIAGESPAEAAKLTAARGLTQQKVHRIMTKLRAVANARHIVITPGGFDLARFSEAVENFLIAHMTNEPGRIIDELEAKLAAELTLFLEAMHG